MGGSSSITYAVPVTKAKQGETAIYRNPEHKNKLLESPSEKVKTMKDILINSGRKFGQKECLGTIIREEGKEPYVRYITYEQMVKQAANLGSGITNMGLSSDPEEEHGFRFIGIFSRNRAAWTITDVACVLYGLVTIPIYDTLGDQNISYVLNHTNLTTCFVNDKSVSALIKTHDLAKLNTLICYDPIVPEQIEKLAERGVKLISYEDVIKSGTDKYRNYNDTEFARKPEDCLTFSYTSGTTGPPKGAMLSHKNLASFCASAMDNHDLAFGPNDTCISYLPLPHILERELLYSLMCCGGRIVYYSGDVQKIKDDLVLVKPTIFVSVPRLFSRFHDVIKGKFDEIEGWSKTGLNYGLATKLKNVETNGSFTHRVYDKVFFNKTKQALGGNVRLMVSGSAPLLPDVHKFLKVVMGAPLLEGYGQTESTGGVTVTSAYDPDCGQIGGPAANVEIKLVDIPEMNYTSKDKDEHGNLRPRGELWLRGPAVFMGYYKNPEKTKETINEDGWLLTGDVGAIMPGKNSLKLIDRKKNIFKLQQGEYVAPQKVEGYYMKSENVQEVFVHGDSSQSFALAIVTPVKANIVKMGQDLGIEGTYEELCKNKAIRTEILTELSVFGKKGGLMSFQQAKNIYLEPIGFMIRGILTNTMKIQRHEGRKQYANEIQAMYAEGMLPAKKEK